MTFAYNFGHDFGGAGGNIIAFVSEHGRCSYEFTTVGDVQPYEADDYVSNDGESVRGTGFETVELENGHTLVRGSTGYGHGDAFYVTDRIVDADYSGEMYVEWNRSPITLPELYGRSPISVQDAVRRLYDL